MSEFYMERYTEERKEEWNQFIDKAKNGHFMFDRNYMDYHKDRFFDHSFIISKSNKIISVLPASIRTNSNKELEVISHGGLTFGGLILDISVKASQVLDIFNEIIKYCKQNHIKSIVYKPIPYIYNKLPSQEDLYALYRYGFKLIRRDISSTIFLNEKIKLSKGRKCAINKAIKNGLEATRSFDFKEFIDLEYRVLKEKHNVKPVHTGVEIESLSQKFPNNIKLFTCHKDGRILAGTIIYENESTVHTQYMAVSEEGRDSGALDIIIYYLINDYYKEKLYFDFGISTENNGMYLNDGLIRQKEMFGGRAIAYDFYELRL